jgi:hypothetical protein
MISRQYLLVSNFSIVCGLESPVSFHLFLVFCIVSSLWCQVSCLWTSIQSFVSCILSLVSCLLFSVSRLLSLVSCLLSRVSCLLSLVSCLLSIVFCLLSPASFTLTLRFRFVGLFPWHTTYEYVPNLLLKTNKCVPWVFCFC